VWLSPQQSVSLPYWYYQEYEIGKYYYETTSNGLTFEKRDMQIDIDTQHDDLLSLFGFLTTGKEGETNIWYLLYTESESNINVLSHILMCI
jgi:hypothetical protein